MHAPPKPQAALYRASASMVLCVALVLSAGCGGEPYDYTPVAGQITYEDGSTIPAAELRLMFIPQVEPIDANTHPISGRASVDVATGRFDSVTSHKYGDGVVPGRLKVIVQALGPNGQPNAVVPEAYTRLETTPLEVRTDDAPWRLLIPKPGR